MRANGTPRLLRIFGELPRKTIVGKSGLVGDFANDDCANFRGRLGSFTCVAELDLTQPEVGAIEKLVDLPFTTLSGNAVAPFAHAMAKREWPDRGEKLFGRRLLELEFLDACAELDRSRVRNDLTVFDAAHAFAHLKTGDVPLIDLLRGISLDTAGQRTQQVFPLDFFFVAVHFALY
jgi:hypothetical protein